MRHALSIARRTYVATAQSELQLGVSAVAVPVCGPGGRVIAALEVEVNDVRAEIRSIRPILTVAARSVSRELATSAGSQPTNSPTDPGGADQRPVRRG